MTEKFYKIEVSETEISPKCIIAGTRGSFGLAKLDFILSPEWEGATCQVVFHPRRGKPISVPWTGLPIEIPPEVMKYNGISGYVFSGTFISDGEAEAKQITLPGEIIVLYTLDDKGVNSEGFTPEIHSLILSMIGNLKDLTTEAKYNLVEAINEVASKDDGTIDEETVKDIVNIYFKENPVSVPVKSVNGKTGDVNLDADDVGARPNTWIPSADEVGARPSDWIPAYTDVGADKIGTAESKVGAHNTSDSAHNDIRLLVSGLTERLNALANSDDTTLDQMKEVVDYIKANRDLIGQITTNKVGYADIVNNLTTNVSGKPLSAAQGVALKALVDAITVPTKVSELENDKKYLTSYTETDPTVPSWAKATTKPSYSKSEVGLGNVDNVKQYSALNPPPYPVTSVNGKTGEVTLTSETWTFTLKDGSTVTKKVVLA